VNIFAELVHSVYDFKSYPGFRKNNGGKAFLYGLLLTLIYFVVSMVLPVMATLFGSGGFGNIAREAIPDFRLEDGVLWVEESFDIQQYDTYQGGICLKVDTSRPLTEEITDVDLLAFDRALIMDAEHMIVKADGGAVIRVSYDEMDLGDWDRDSFLNELMPLVPVVLWISLIVILCFGLLGFFLGALVVAVMGTIMSALMGCRLRFGELYKLAIYTRTPALLVEAVYAWLPFTIPFFYIINYGISAVFLWKALKQIKEQEMEPPAPSWTGEV